MRLKIITLSLLFFATISNSCAQIKISDALKKAADLSGNQGNPSQAEIGSALKEALEIGISAGTDRLSIQNGFLGNNAVRLLFPPEAQKAEKTLRSIGLNKLCDDFILSLNRAAESAVKEAKPVFISALKQMSVQDAAGILLSKETNSATNYFQRVTSEALKAKFQPVIGDALSRSEATRYWTEVTSAYNKIPMVSKIETDLTAYATQKAMDGLFHEIAREEQKIRTNPVSRSTALLKKVFGYADGK